MIDQGVAAGVSRPSDNLDRESVSRWNLQCWEA